MTGIRPPTPAALRAYRASTYRAGGIEARIGRRPGPMPGRWSGRALAMLSACNPGGRRYPDGWNRRRMAALHEALRGAPQEAGEGRLGSWSEPLLLVAIAPGRALVLARRFRQNGLVLLNRRQAARLILLTV